MDAKIALDPSIGSEQKRDLNNIKLHMLMKYSLMTLKLVINVFSLAYMIGMFFLVYCQIFTPHQHELDEAMFDDYFLHKNRFEWRSNPD